MHFFYLTSAKESIGIYDLFTEIAKKYLDKKDNNNLSMDENCIKTLNSIDNDSKSSKKSCC